MSPFLDDEHGFYHINHNEEVEQQNNQLPCKRLSLRYDKFKEKFQLIIIMEDQSELVLNLDHLSFYELLLQGSDLMNEYEDELDT